MIHESKHGRPAHVPTDKEREIAYDLARWGRSQRDIARSLYISVPTLRRHFDEEIRAGPVHRRAEVINMIFESARAGKVSAMWTIYQMTGKVMRRAK
jgi:DNA-binding NarL/FixJ family response regulator